MRNEMNFKCFINFFIKLKHVNWINTFLVYKLCTDSFTQENIDSKARLDIFGTYK